MKFISIVFMIIFITSSIFPLNIITTVNPYYLLLKEITAGADNVSLLIEPGQNPHVYSPNVEDIRKLSSADLIIANGFDLESFLIEKLNWLEHSGKRVIFVSTYIDEVLRSSSDSKSNEDHINPHIWLGFSLLTEYIIPGLTNDLSKIEPSKAGLYSENAQKLINNLRDMHRDLSEYLLPLSGKKVLMSHPSFYYFFRDFGIDTVSLFEGHGDEPTISELKDIIKAAKSGEFIAAFGEYQQNNKSIEIVIKETGIDNSELDPLGIGRKDFEDFLKWNINRITEVINVH
ncbi:metal ABC transporter substrate-binding protein [Kosmotoga arenicorallina]|nr:metal ABC transporter substrate-binding protein [Kosmotoga arenicorallina]